MGYIRRRQTKGGVRYYPCIGNHTFGGFARKKDAEKKLREVESQGPLARVRFSDFAERWLEYKSHRVTTSSFALYRVQVSHLTESLGNVYLDDMTPLSVSEMTRKLAGKYKPRTVNHILTVLKDILNYAVRLELLAKAPLIESVRVPPTEARFLTQKEIQSLLEKPRKDLYATALLTGMRGGELRALRWSDIGESITVSRSFGKHGYGPPKSGKPRVVHISPALRRVLDNRPHHFDLVFSENGNPVSNMNRRYREDGGPGTFHSLRHTYAAMMLAAGVSVKYLQEQMGHASIKTTLDLYGHLIPEIHAETLVKLDSVMFDSRVIRIDRRAQDGQG